MAQLVIWGAGAIGGTIGAFLAKDGHDVVFVDVVAEHVAAIRDEGLRITGPVAEFTVRAKALTPDEMQGRHDVIVLSVKAHHTHGATQALVPFLAPAGVVVSAQNGLNETEIAKIVGAPRTFGCFVNFGADYLEPGVIHFGGRGSVVLGELDGRETLRARRLLGLFQAFEPRATLSDNVWGYLWSKLAYASMLFATALSTESIADALDRPEHRETYAELAREVVRVARASLIRLESFDGFEPAAFSADAAPGDVARSMDELVAHNRRSAKSHSGIWRDLAVRHRRTEVDAQLGPVVSRAAELTVPAPLNQRLIAMIHEIEDGRRVQTPANVGELTHLPEGA